MKSPYRDGERILIYGPEGAGKTTNWISMARMFEATSPSTHFYVIDTDDAVNAMLDRMDQTDSPSPKNITVFLAAKWEEIEAAAKKIKEVRSPTDWFVVDFMGDAWDMAQGYFAEQVFGTSMSAHFLEFRKQNTKGLAVDGNRDWPTINKLYTEFAVNYIRRMGCNVLCTAKADKVDDRDSLEIKTAYSTFGLKPKGQKNIGNLFATVILQVWNGTSYTMTTTKDRERAKLRQSSLTNFPIDYLMSIAHWSIA